MADFIELTWPKREQRKLRVFKTQLQRNTESKIILQGLLQIAEDVSGEIRREIRRGPSFVEAGQGSS